MTEPRRPDHRSQTPGREGPRIDEELLARAAEINEAVAGEFAKKAVSPLDNPVIGRMAELGVETDAAVSVALQRAHRIAFYMRAWTHASRRGRARHRCTPAGRRSARPSGRPCSLVVGRLTTLHAQELRRHVQER